METKHNISVLDKERLDKGQKGITVDQDYPDMLTVAPSPHIRHKDTTARLMNTVSIAILPALIFSIVMAFLTDVSYGIGSVAIVVTSVFSCVLFEWVFQKILKRPTTIRDGSAVVTGLLLATGVSPTLPVWQIVVGAFFAIVIVKGLFGGLGKNIVNPALAARVFLFLSYPNSMSDFPSIKYATLDAGAGATPLGVLKDNLTSSLEAVKEGMQTDIDVSGLFKDLNFLDMFLGFKNGTLGEVSVLLLLLGGLFLLWRKVITWHIPVAYIGTVAVLTFLFPLGNAGRVEFMLFHLLSGSLVLGAFFMATDYATSPVTSKGRLLYAVLCGVVTVLIRYFGTYPEGVSFAILIANLLVYYIDKITKPRRFGARSRRQQEGQNQ